MKDIIGIPWYKDEATYRRALVTFDDTENMPASYKGWKALVERQLEMIRSIGNTALRVDIDPEAFVAWCVSRGIIANPQGIIAFVNHAELEYRKTGQGEVIE